LNPAREAISMRNVEDFLSSFNRCLQKESAFCTAACPFHVDISSMIARIQKGSYLAAFRMYRDAVTFPRIVSTLCPAPCRDVCPLREKGADKDHSIDLPLIERLLIGRTGGTESNQYNLPSREQRVAIIGAGISGLGCALRLAAKKYRVEMFERTGRIGGQAREAMDADVFDRDIAEQFRHEQYTLHLNQSVQDREALNRLGFDAVFVATGAGGTNFGLLTADVSEIGRYCLEDIVADNMVRDHQQPVANALATRAGLGTGKPKERIAWFAGGSLVGLPDHVHALADGLLIANAIDNYLKTGRLVRPQHDFTTGMKLDPYKKFFHGMVSGFLKNGAGDASVSSGTAPPSVLENQLLSESLRCMRCACDACRLHCDLTDYYKKWPLRIRDEVFATTLPGQAEVKATPAKRLMSTCNQCGICRSTCPQDIDLGGLILAGRQSMHRQEKAPWAFHDFWLRDMAFSDGSEAHLCRMPDASIAAKDVSGSMPDFFSGTASGTAPKADFLSTPGPYVFFPGCQIGASDPDIVIDTYRALRSIDPGMGILLRCCGAPAEWAGDDETHQAALSAIQSDLDALGNPTLLAACPTCIKKFQTYLPKAAVQSVYEWIAENKHKWNAPPILPECKDWAVFDPCAAGASPELKEAVRFLGTSIGLNLHPLPIQDQIARCCGYGGQPAIANPDYAHFVAKKRTSESPLPYIAYCINCRDVFRHGGKKSLHLLELLFCRHDTPQTDLLSQPHPTVTVRRENRQILKSTLLSVWWNEEFLMEKPQYDFSLAISDDLRRHMDAQRILEDEIHQVVDHMRRTGKRVLDPKSGIRSGYLQIGHMTFWAAYRETDQQEILELVSAWSHRMTFEAETVWRGVKQVD
jgi:Fe-S oxidoreductase